MTVTDWHAAPPMTEEQRRNAMADIAAIVRGEELDARSDIFSFEIGRAHV